MPPIGNQTDEDEDVLVSSTDTTLDVADAEPNGEAEALANSSDATGEQPDDTLSIVRDVVGADKGEAGAASPAEGEAGSEAGGAASTKEPDNENFTDVPFHKHPRFQALVQQRNDFKVDAVRYQNVQTFLDSNGLSADEAANGLSTMALAKTNPAKAWAEIKPWVQQLLVAAGEVLPADLAQRVEKGELTQDAAFELSRSRATLASGETRKTFEQQQQERREQTAHSTSLVNTADAWEKDRQIKDPNFAAKKPLLQREIAFLHATEGKPNTVAGVSDQLKRAYDAVNKSFTPPAAQKPQARRPAIKPVMGGTVAGNAGATTKPGSTLDIVRANRRTG